MDVSVCGPGPAAPFLSAQDIFETACDLTNPVTVSVVDDPDERTRVRHTDSEHEMIISRHAATSAMARELALHEYAHMHHYEHDHPSHTQSTKEAIFLALAGHSVERRKLTHCYQIANHLKDIYADDLWLGLGPSDKLVSFLESSLATTLATTPQPTPPVGQPQAGTAHPEASLSRRTPTPDPEITAVNAAFALGLVERHDLIDETHRLYDLARAAAADAPAIDFETFNHTFRSLSPDPDQSEYRKILVELTELYAGRTEHRAAD